MASPSRASRAAASPVRVSPARARPAPASLGSSAPERSPGRASHLFGYRAVAPVEPAAVAVEPAAVAASAPAAVADEPAVDTDATPHAGTKHAPPCLHEAGAPPHHPGVSVSFPEPERQASLEEQIGDIEVSSDLRAILARRESVMFAEERGSSSGGGADDGAGGGAAGPTSKAAEAEESSQSSHSTRPRRLRSRTLTGSLSNRSNVSRRGSENFTGFDLTEAADAALAKSQRLLAELSALSLSTERFRMRSRSELTPQEVEDAIRGWDDEDEEEEEEDEASVYKEQASCPDSPAVSDPGERREGSETEESFASPGMKIVRVPSRVILSNMKRFAKRLAKAHDEEPYDLEASKDSTDPVDAVGSLSTEASQSPQPEHGVTPQPSSLQEPEHSVATQPASVQQPDVVPKDREARPFSPQPILDHSPGVVHHRCCSPIREPSPTQRWTSPAMQCRRSEDPRRVPEEPIARRCEVEWRLNAGRTALRATSMPIIGTRAGPARLHSSLGEGPARGCSCVVNVVGPPGPTGTSSASGVHLGLRTSLPTLPSSPDLRCVHRGPVAVGAPPPVLRQVQPVQPLPSQRPSYSPRRQAKSPQGCSPPHSPRSPRLARHLVWRTVLITRVHRYLAWAD